MCIGARGFYDPGRDDLGPRLARPAGAARRRRGAARAGADPAHPVSDPARARRARHRLHPRRAALELRPDDRARRLPAAAALLGGVLHLAARPAHERAGDLAAFGRASCSRRCSRSPPSATPSIGRPLVAGLLRDRRDRRADRCRRGDGDRLAPRPPAPARDADRGREPDQRRHGARGLLLRRRRRRDRQLLALARDLALRRRRRRRHRRSASWSASCCASSGAGINHSPTEIAIALLSGYFAYLPAAGGRRLGGARRRHRRRLRGLVHARADDRADAAAGRRRLGDPHVPAQRGAVRPRRAAAAADPRLAPRALDGGAARRRRDRQPGGDRHAPRLDLPRDVHPALAHVEAHPRARPLPALAVPGPDRLGRTARSGLARRGARAAAHDRRRGRVPAALATSSTWRSA